jgi:hypothetical protein
MARYDRLDLPMRMTPPVLDAIMDMGERFPRTSEYLKERMPKFPQPRPMAYIAGPIFGIPVEQRDASFAAGRALANRYGYDAVLPTEIETPEHEGPCPVGRQSDNELHTEACKLRSDFKILLDCEAFIVMPGWTSSWGSKLEIQIATSCGHKVYFADLPLGPEAPRLGSLIRQ